MRKDETLTPFHGNEPAKSAVNELSPCGMLILYIATDAAAARLKTQVMEVTAYHGLSSVST
jgi:hypothetical protein